MGRICSNCGQRMTLVLQPAKGVDNPTPTPVCHRCDYIKLWPAAERALRRRK